MPQEKALPRQPSLNFIDLQRLRKQEVSLTMTWDKYVLNLSDQVTITIKYEHTTHIPTMYDYKSIYSPVEYPDRTECVTSDKNQNLTHLEKLFLQWNFKLGYTGFSTVQCIGRQSSLVKLVYNMVSNNLNITKWENFQYGKQEKNPNSGTRKRDPGKLIFNKEY